MPTWLARRVGLLAGLVLAGTGPAAAQERLPDVRTSARSPCRLDPASGIETADLWVSARTALEGSLTADPDPPSLLIQKWRRRLSPSLVPLYERRDTLQVATRRPFGVTTPSNIERAGYIQRVLRSIIFYGPDPDEILTERFLRQHCFRRTAGSGATEGLVGLRFEPLPTQDHPDVTGVLWIDPAGRALRYVEYSWTNPPPWGRGPHAGGRTDFVRLAGDGWVIQRWYIRTPSFSTGPFDALDGYTDEGGELLAVGPPMPRRKRP